MVGGESASVGIVFYDTEKKNENAVFGFYKGSEPFFKTFGKGNSPCFGRNPNPFRTRMN